MQMASDRDSNTVRSLEALQTAAAVVMYEVYLQSGRDLQVQIAEKVGLDGLEQHQMDQGMGKWFMKHEDEDMTESVGFNRWTDELILLGLSWILDIRIEYHQIEGLSIGPAMPVTLSDDLTDSSQSMWHRQKLGIGQHFDGMYAQGGKRGAR